MFIGDSLSNPQNFRLANYCGEMKTLIIIIHRYQGKEGDIYLRPIQVYLLDQSQHFIVHFFRRDWCPLASVILCKTIFQPPIDIDTYTTYSFLIHQ